MSYYRYQLFVCLLFSQSQTIRTTCHCLHQDQSLSEFTYRLQFYQGWIGAVASRCFPQSTLSLASEQDLKDLKRSQGLQRGGEVANWALRTSPKFTTEVTYQFHQGFWPDKRSGNPIKNIYYGQNNLLWNSYLRLLYTSSNIYRNILNVLIQNLMRIEHFQICILKIINISEANGSIELKFCILFIFMV